MYHDPEVYENPSDFFPERFLQSEYGTREEARKDDHIRRHTYAFGSGRVGEVFIYTSNFTFECLLPIAIMPWYSSS